MSERFPDEILRELVAAHVRVGGELAFSRPSTGKFNTTYFVEGAERPLVLRIAPPDDAGFVFYEKRMMAQEPGIHRLIRERTSAPVAEILAYDNSRKLIDRDYLLMERLPGVPLTEFRPAGRQTDKVLHQTGMYLREIHDLTAKHYGYLGEHRCMEPQADWAGAFTVMWDKMADDVVQAGYYDAEEETWIKGLLRKHIVAFDRPVTSRLLHMDIWSQNIMVDEDANVTGLIDFDRALWGDKEIEFAVLDYCGISRPAFWSGYGMERDESPEAQIRQVLYLAYEVQKYIVIHHYRHGDVASARWYKQQVWQLLAPLI
jgi:aminoglycoside phosphotransferase (APT) family kinase protein